VLTGQGEHGSVVTGIAGAVEERHAGDRRDRLGQPVDDVETTPLRYVRDRLDQHVLMLPSRGCLGVADQASSSMGTRTPRSLATSIARS
jgi:hypothetical protein